MRGTVRRRGSGYEAVIDLPRGVDGRRRQKSKTFQKRKEADDWLAKVQAQVADGFHVDLARMTIGVFLDQWLDAERPSLKPNTISFYENSVRRWKGVIGSIALEKVSALDVQAGTNKLAQRYAASSVRRSLTTLKTAFGRAVAWGLLPRNPAESAKSPRVARTEMRCWSESEATKFLQAVEGETRYDVLFRLALASGMRVGELTALMWTDIDWTGMTVAVKRNLSWPQGGSPTIEDLKSAASRRTIAIDRVTMDLLKLQRRRYAENPLTAGSGSVHRAHRDLVFATSTGGYVHRRHLEKVLDSVSERAGLPPIRFHDLRHTHATLLLRQGRRIEEVAKRLGHADPATTLRLYSHVLADQQPELAAAIGCALDGTAIATRK